MNVVDSSVVQYLVVFGRQKSFKKNSFLWIEWTARGAGSFI